MNKFIPRPRGAVTGRWPAPAPLKPSRSGEAQTIVTTADDAHVWDAVALVESIRTTGEWAGPIKVAFQVPGEFGHNRSVAQNEAIQVLVKQGVRILYSDPCRAFAAKGHEDIKFLKNVLLYDTRFRKARQVHFIDCRYLCVAKIRGLALTHCNAPLMDSSTPDIEDAANFFSYFSEGLPCPEDMFQRFDKCHPLNHITEWKQVYKAISGTRTDFNRADFFKSNHDMTYPSDIDGEFFEEHHALKTQALNRA